MSVKISDLLKTAGNSLKGKWLLSIGISLVYYIIIIVLSFIPLIGSIINFVIAGPLLVGLSKYFISIVRNEEVSFNLLFYGFSNQNFARSFVGYLLYLIFLFLWSLIFFVPFFIIMVFFGFSSAMSSADPMSFVNSLMNNPTFLIVLLLSFLLLIPTIIAILVYSMTFYIIADDKEISGFGAIKNSIKIMKGNKGKLFLLMIIFGIFCLLSLLTLGIAYIWLVPFSMTVFAAFYDRIK